ncbi:MAG: hypothetical protein ABW079_12070 [Sedimenticola sp.]
MTKYIVAVLLVVITISCVQLEADALQYNDLDLLCEKYKSFFLQQTASGEEELLPDYFHSSYRDLKQMYTKEFVSTYDDYKNRLDYFYDSNSNNLLIISLAEKDFMSHTISSYILGDQKFRDKITQHPVVYVDYSGFPDDLQKVAFELRLPSPSIVTLSKDSLSKSWKKSSALMLDKCMTANQILNALGSAGSH